MQRARRILFPGIQIVSVLHADRAQNGFPPKAQAGRKKMFITGPLLEPTRECDAVQKQDNQPTARQRLFNFEGSGQECFSADQSSFFIPRRGFPFLESSYGIFTPEKIALVER